MVGSLLGGTSVSLQVERWAWPLALRAFPLGGLALGGLALGGWVLGGLAWGGPLYPGVPRNRRRAAWSPHSGDD